MQERPYRRLSPLTPLVRSFIIVVAVAATSWDDLLRGELGPLGWMLVFLLVGGAGYGTASWLRTKYWIEADELRVDTGVISRQSRRVRIDRLQGVDIVQPFVARLFGLAELRMDVAGGTAREGSLAFMRLAEARELKDLLLARRDAVRGEAAERARVAAGDTAAATAATPQPPPPERPLARVDLDTLALSILLSGETVAFLAAATFFGAAFLVTGQWAGLATVVPVLGGFVLVAFRKLSGYYRFTVSETAAGFQVRRGMFELSSQTIALARLQGVVISEPLLWRRMGWARLDVSIAGYNVGADGDEHSPSTVMPVADRRLVMALVRHMLDGVDPDQVPLAPPPRRSRWLAPVGWRFMRTGADDALVVSREGWFSRRTHVVPHARVQSVRVSQGPLQRALGLADLHVDSPPGPVDVRGRHRLPEEARAMLEQEVAVSREARHRLPSSGV